MSDTRQRTEAPPVVTAVAGGIVAVVSAVFGVSAHGLAAGTGAGLPAAEELLAVVAACAGVGAVTTALARRRAPIVVSALGLLLGQLLVHLSLAAGHVGGDDGAAGHAHGPAEAAAVHSALVHPTAHTADLWTPGMLLAHLAAIAVTLAVVAALAGMLGWVAARVAPLVRPVHLVVVGRIRIPRLPVVTADAGYLLARGGTRAPPVAV